MSEDRYTKEHKHGNVSFYLEDFHADMEQCRFLMLKVLEQAVRDYVSLYESNITNEQAIWEEARDFLYQDEYLFMWGDTETTTTEFLDVLDLDIAWVREQTTRKLKDRIDNNGT